MLTIHSVFNMCIVVTITAKQQIIPKLSGLVEPLYYDLERCRSQIGFHNVWASAGSYSMTEGWNHLEVNGG